MPFVSGFLHVREPGSPDNSLPGGGGYPDNSLPGSQPGIDNSLPMPPPGVWPPPVPAHPIVPAPPGTPPGQIWPPVGSSGRPDQGLPPSSGRPDQGLPPTGSPGAPSHPIATPPSTFWVVAGIPGYGWRYVAVDPSLRPDNSLPISPGHPSQGLPGAPARPGNELPETPQPKR